jgi:hypothetical protein
MTKIARVRRKISFRNARPAAGISYLHVQFQNSAQNPLIQTFTIQMGLFQSKEEECRECGKTFAPKKPWHIYCRKCFKAFLSESYEKDPEFDRLCFCGKGIRLSCSRCISSAQCCTHCLYDKPRGSLFDIYSLHYCADCI